MATQAGFGLDLPGDFDEDQAAIERRRQQLIGAMRNPIGGAGTGWAGGIANFLQNAIGTNLLEGQDTKGKDLAQRRDAYAQEALSRLFKPDTPAQPEVAGTGPLAPPPGTPGVEPSGGGSTPMNTPEPGPNAPPAAFSATPSPPPDTPAGWTTPGGEIGNVGMIPKGPDFAPNKAATPMIPGVVNLAERMKIVSDLAKGGPMYAKIAEKVMTQGLEAPEKEAARAAAAKDKADLAREARVQRMHELNLKLAEASTEKEKDRIHALQLEEYRAANAYERKELGGIIAEGLKGLGGAGAAGNFNTEGTSIRGNPVLRNTKGTDFVEIVNGERVPYTDKIIKPGEEKTVNAAMTSQAQQAYTQQLIDRVNDPKNAKAFSGAANIGGALSTKTEGFVPSDIFAKLTDEQQTLRAEVNRNFAELIHQMYGSAYTAGERARGGAYTILPGDKGPKIAQKLQQQKAFLQEMDAKYGDKVRAAAAARSTGGTRKPISEY